MARSLRRRRAGFTLIELLVAISVLGLAETGVDLSRLTALCQRVADCAGRPLSTTTPVVGSSVFQHESGIHTSSLLRDPLAFQPFLPQDVGAKPTTFAEPTFVVGLNVLYYAVDHSPSYLWGSATWEISEALLPFLRTVMDGPDSWDHVPTIRRAIEIRQGAVQNPAILAFQGRSEQHPHPIG